MFDDVIEDDAIELNPDEDLQWSESSEDEIVPRDTGIFDYD